MVATRSPILPLPPPDPPPRPNLPLPAPYRRLRHRHPPRAAHLPTSFCALVLGGRRTHKTARAVPVSAARRPRQGPRPAPQQHALLLQLLPGPRYPMTRHRHLGQRRRLQEHERREGGHPTPPSRCLSPPPPRPALLLHLRLRGWRSSASPAPALISSCALMPTRMLCACVCMCVHVGVYARVRSMGLSVHARARTAHAQRGVCARTIRACARSLVRSLAPLTTHKAAWSWPRAASDCGCRRLTLAGVLTAVGAPWEEQLSGGWRLPAPRTPGPCSSQRGLAVVDSIICVICVMPRPPPSAPTTEGPGHARHPATSVSGRVRMVKLPRLRQRAALLASAALLAWLPVHVLVPVHVLLPPCSNARDQRSSRRGSPRISRTAGRLLDPTHAVCSRAKLVLAGWALSSGQETCSASRPSPIKTGCGAKKRRTSAALLTTAPWP